MKGILQKKNYQKSWLYFPSIILISDIPNSSKINKFASNSFDCFKYLARVTRLCLLMERCTFVFLWHIFSWHNFRRLLGFPTAYPIIKDRVTEDFVYFMTIGDFSFMIIEPVIKDISSGGAGYFKIGSFRFLLFNFSTFPILKFTFPPLFFFLKSKT